MSTEKQEQATEQRKRKAREGGDIPTSRDLTSAVVMLGSLLVLGPATTRFVSLWRIGLETSTVAAPDVFASPAALAKACLVPFTATLVPVTLVLLTALAAAVFTGVAQAGSVQFHVGTLGWKLGRISPMAHGKHVFGLRAWMRLLKSMLPAAGVIWVAQRRLAAQMTASPFLTPQRIPASLQTAYELALTAAWIAAAWSGLDYAMERRAWSQKLRMSKQEIRDEARESSGNPQIKGRVRQIQRAMRRRRVKADVSQATVVITNPTHYAVALSFDMTTMAAPRVLCKGRDLLAAAIREEARWAGVPIVENPPLARSLYRAVDEGQAIPFELYTAVAAVLAFLLRRPSPTVTPAGPSRGQQETS